MNSIRKYWPVVAIVIAFVAGIFLAPRSDKDLKSSLAKQREQHHQEKKALNARIKARDTEIITIRKVMKERAAKDSLRLIASNKEIKRLRRKIDETNYSSASARELDSLRHALWSSNPLHSTD